MTLKINEKNRQLAFLLLEQQELRNYLYGRLDLLSKSKSKEHVDWFKDAKTYLEGELFSVQYNIEGNEAELKELEKEQQEQQQEEEFKTK